MSDQNVEPAKRAEKHPPCRCECGKDNVQNIIGQLHELVAKSQQSQISAHGMRMRALSAINPTTAEYWNTKWEKARSEIETLRTVIGVITEEFNI